MRLKIGEFARLAQVSVQTLRYYGDLGLLEPNDVDPFSGYRYYRLDQLRRLMRILALKDLGVSLDQIGCLLAEGMSTDDLRRVLTLKQHELRDQVQEQLERLERIDARLQMIAGQESPPIYDVVVKSVAPLWVASVRGVVPAYSAVSPLWNELFAALEGCRRNPCGPCLTLCHAVEPEIDLEVCAPLAEPAEIPGATVRQLPAVESMACAVHAGAFSSLIHGYTALFQWIDLNDYAIAGPDREVYLRLPSACESTADPTALTELQIPVRKVARPTSV
jgi:DNA-binding transcriptional MerR regulator